jgi:cell wall-associated NlpC family hydrolase
MPVVTGNDLVFTARKFEWVGYLWGGSNPNFGWDCSGYMNWIIGGIYHLAIPGFNAGAFGVNSGHGPVVADWIQWIGVTRGMFGPVTPLPGDLIAWGPNQHMGMAINGTRFVSAANPMQGTFEADIGSFFNWAPFVLRLLEIRTGATVPAGVPIPPPLPRNPLTNWAATIGATSGRTERAASNLSKFATVIRRT